LSTYPHYARWANILSEFNFKIYYHPGHENTLADTLSHNPLLAPTAEELSSDFTQTLIPPERFVSAFAFSTIPKPPVMQVEDPDCHNSPLGGHFGAAKTLDLIFRVQLHLSHL
jgi:hypothetical protein